MFEILPLGVGDTFSTQHHTSAVLLLCDGMTLGIDCPDSYARVLKEASTRSGRSLHVSDVGQVIITHVHGDHMNGLEGLAFYKHFAENGRLRLAASPEVRAIIWEERLKSAMGTLWNGERFRQLNFEDYFDFVPLSWTEETVIGPFRVRTRRTIHHVPTSALMIEAGGHVFGYSADTAFDPGLIDFLAPADLIVHETNLGPAHTPWTELEKLPIEIRRKMRLIHYPDGFEQSGCTIPLLREGEIVAV